MQTLGFAMCGSFCTMGNAMEQLAELRKTSFVLPIMSRNVYATETRFGKAADFIKKAQELTGQKVLHSIVEAEPIGPKHLVDAMVVCPCTGNTLSKMALGITDTPVTMAVKSTLRVGLPVIICLASNDAIAASGQNAARLMNTKNVYFVPLRQDDPIKKPFSLVADFTLLGETVELALAGEQLQPIYR